jgi:CRISPR system Cascade subunit CasA
LKNEKSPDFNLLHQPWITVRSPDGSRKDLSLLSLFKDSHLYQTLSGELPAQNIAILRLLLAVLHSVPWGFKDAEHASEFI